MRTSGVATVEAKKAIASGVGHRFMCSKCRAFQYMDFMIEKGVDGDVLRKTCQRCGAHVDFVWIAGADAWMIESMVATFDNFAEASLEAAWKRVQIKEFLRQYDEAEDMALGGEEPETKLGEWLTAKYKTIPAKKLLARIKEKRSR